MFLNEYFTDKKRERQQSFVFLYLFGVAYFLNDKKPGSIRIILRKSRPLPQMENQLNRDQQIVTHLPKNEGDDSDYSQAGQSGEDDHCKV